MHALITTGSWLSRLMTVLFFLLLSSALLTLLGLGTAIFGPLHNGLGIIFSLFFLLHLAAASLNAKPEVNLSSSTILHYFTRQQALTIVKKYR